MRTNQTIGERVCCCTRLEMLSSTRGVVAGCGRCVIGAQTLEERRKKMGRDAEDVKWYEAPPTVTFHCGNGTTDHSLGVVDVPCVMGGKPIQITVRVVPGEVPCLLSKRWLKENGAIIDTHAGFVDAYETRHLNIVD